MPGEPLLVPLGALLFYLLDGILLLYGNECALEARGGGFRSGTGLDTLLAGRRPWWPQPLAPWRPVWRLAWSETGEPPQGEAPEAAAARIGAARRALRTLGWVAALLFWLMIPGMAALFLLGRLGPELLALLAAVYGLVLAAIGCLWWQRHALGLAAGACASLSAECLLCPPLAINVVRKVSLRQAIKADPLALLRACGAPRADVAALALGLARRVREARDGLAEDEPRRALMAERIGELERAAS